MKRHLLLTASFVFASLTLGMAAQTPPPAPAPTAPAAKPVPRSEPPDWVTQAEQSTPLRLQFVISKYQGDKKISSVPYVVSVNANQRRNTSLRMGGQVPIPMGGDKGVSYRDIGTNIDVAAFSQTGQLFRLEVALEDSSVHVDEKTGTGSALPAFRSFKTTNNIVLKDGQTTQIASAADPVTGEVMRVDVTLTVVK